jgi:hypothetical protein
VSLQAKTPLRLARVPTDARQFCPPNIVLLENVRAVIEMLLLD